MKGRFSNILRLGMLRNWAANIKSIPASSLFGTVFHSFFVVLRVLAARIRLLQEQIYSILNASNLPHNSARTSSDLRIRGNLPRLFKRLNSTYIRFLVYVLALC